MNIAEEPEKFGLEILHDLDRSSGDYEFDRMIVFVDRARRIFTACDAGCPCPMPFEGIGLEDLNEVTAAAWSEFEQGFRSWCAPEYGPGIDAVTQAAVLHDLKRRLDVFA